MRSDTTGRPVPDTATHRAIAARIAAEFNDDTNVEAIIVTGSVARGDVDAASDVDCIFFLNDPPGEEFFETQCALATDSGGEVYGGTAADGFGVFRYVGGVKVDLGFGFVRETDGLIRSVMEDFDTDLTKQLIIGGIRQSIVLRGEGHVTRWRKATDAYPDGLRDAMIRAHLGQRPLWVLREMGAARGERLFLNEEFLGIARRVLALLYAVNRVYHPGKLKGASSTRSPFTLAPPDLYARLERWFTSDVHVAVADCEALVNDVYTLLQAECPALGEEVSRAQSRFNRDFSNRD